MIGALEDAEDYRAFEEAITADYDAQSAVERELVLRLASLLWRLRRATTMETGLFEIQADHLSEARRDKQRQPKSRELSMHFSSPPTPLWIAIQQRIATSGRRKQRSSRDENLSSLTSLIQLSSRAVSCALPIFPTSRLTV